MDPILALSINEFLGQPPVASEHGSTVDNMLEFVHWFMLIVGVGWTIFFFYVLFRFSKKRNPNASYAGMTSHFTTHLEVGVVIVEVVLLLFFAFPLWSNRVDAMPQEGDGQEVVRVRAVGQQFFWTFHYPGADGKFGLVRPDRMDENIVGLVMEDPNAHDDFFSQGNLILPKDRKAVVQVTSKDVIHNLSLVPMRTQQDAIPGQEIPMYFTPIKTGEWDIICGQLCGSGHAVMKAYLEVQEEEAFDSWFKDQSEGALAKATK